MRNILQGKVMTVHPDCYPCFLKQATRALEAAGAPRDKRFSVLKSVLADLKAADVSMPPSYVSTSLHRRVRKALDADPFANLKRLYNETGLTLYPRLEAMVSSSEDPLYTAIRLAIAGNIIDFGIYDEVDIEGSIKRAINEPLDVDTYELFVKDLASARKVFYLLDNAGEIVFDMLLIEALRDMGKSVTAVVRGGPIINDVTMQDALQVGLDAVCELMDNGSDSMGTVLEHAPEALREAFSARGTLVISKGQGNFETLLQQRGDIYFLLQAKCSVVAGLLGVDEGAMLMLRSLRPRG